MKQPWVMENVRSLTTHEDMNDPDGEDYLSVVRRVRPELLPEDRMWSRPVAPEQA